MYSEDEIVRFQSIFKKLNSINTIISRHGGIVKALEDIDEGRPALLMLLIAISEQFNKLQKNEKLIEDFKDINIKGIFAVRNFIAHDYDGVSLSIIEDGLRYEIPLIFDIVKDILEKNKGQK